MSAVRGLNVTLYTELFKRCPKEQLRFLRKVEAKHKSYIDKINSLPASLPKIDWDFYRSKVREKYIFLVDEFECKYNDFQVPIPTENATSEIQEECKAMKVAVEEYCQQRSERIEELECEIHHVNEKIPFDQMTWEEYIDLYPETAPNFICKPTFWPHTPEEQEIGPPKNVHADH